MKVQLIDPRDTRREDDRPTYRVYFWEVTQNTDNEASTQSSEEFEIQNAANVHEVFAWAGEQAAAQKRWFEVFLVTETEAAGKCLSRLA